MGTYRQMVKQMYGELEMDGERMHIRNGGCGYVMDIQNKDQLSFQMQVISENLWKTRHQLTKTLGTKKNHPIQRQAWILLPERMCGLVAQRCTGRQKGRLFSAFCLSLSHTWAILKIKGYKPPIALHCIASIVIKHKAAVRIAYCKLYKISL